jgi:ribosomal protein L16 Arg81 hydroxylase
MTQLTLDLSIPCSVEQAKDLSYEDFMQKYFLPQKPVLLKGLAHLQPAGKKWTIDWFKETMGDYQISVFDFNKPRHKYSTVVDPDSKMLFRDFLDLISRDEPSSIRMFRYDLFKQNPALRKDFSCPSFINKGIMKKFGFMFLGGKDADVRLHYDVDNSSVLLTQIYGSKRVVLFDPDQSKFLYQIPFTTHSLVDLKKPDFEKWPGLKYVKGYEVIQEPGDGIFMPSGYWHYNTYLNGGISVSFRKLAPTLRGVIRGLRVVVVNLILDRCLSLLLGKRYNDWKQKKCIQQVEQAIHHAEKLKSDAADFNR